MSRVISHKLEISNKLRDYAHNPVIMSTMQTLIRGSARLGIELTPTQVEQFQRYYELLAEWNKRVNLTGVTDYEEVQTKHFLDSLTIIPALNKQKDAADLNIIDVGSGAGLPGIPLKIVLGQAELVLLESVGKKTAFLEELVRQLLLDKVQVITGRAEEVAHQPEYRQRFSVVVSRALAKLPTLVELTLPFCQVGGVTIAQKKGGISREIDEAAAAITVLGGKPLEVSKIELPGISSDRCLVIIDKVQSTPTKYPRRSGMPAKRPIK